MSSGFYSSSSESVPADSDTPVSPVDTDLLKAWPQKSMYVIKELLTTEKGYVDSLDEVIQGYLKPLYEYLFSASQGPKFIETVFCDIQKLYNIHVDVYNSLLSSCSDPSSLGQVFVKNADNFKEYTKYCTNFPKCEELLQHVMKTEPETRDFIVQCQVDIGHCLPLVTYLHKPVQRILKYRLLLEQTLKGMSSNMQGFVDMQSALKVMCDVALEINERKKQHENVERVENIQRSLKGLKSAGLCGGDLRSCGSLVFEEKCKLLGTFDRERIMMLFETCLLFLRAKGSQKYIYKWHVLVQELDVCVVGGQSNVFEVFSVYKPSQKVTVEVKSTSVRDKIVGQIQSLLVKDLKAQQNMRTATLKRPRRNDRTQLESNKRQENNFVNRKQQNGENSFNTAHKRSLVAKELQSRRRARQMSTRKWPQESSESNTEKNDELTSSHSEMESSTLEASTSSVVSSNGDSGKEGTEKATEGRSLDDKKLRRRTAMRRKPTSKAQRISSVNLPPNDIEPPATITYSAPLGSDMPTWYNDEYSSNVIVRGSTDDTSLLESSLDRGMRLQHNNLELSDEVESSLDISKRTPEVVEMPEWNFTESELEPEPSGDHLPEYPLEYPLMSALADEENNRLRINSKDYDVVEASLCSNISSLSAEDHYYLTSTSNSSIVAGKDGDSITIYDDDSDDSESDEEYQNELIHEVNGSQPQHRYENNVVEKSLRSYLSMAELWNGSLDEEERAISPLATLPRLPSASLVRLRSQKPKLSRSSTVDVFQSLPVGSLATNKDTKLKKVPSPLYDQKQDENDLLESFSLSLPKTPTDNGNCHRDSWLPPEEGGETSNDRREDMPWIVERYLSEEAGSSTDPLEESLLPPSASYIPQATNDNHEYSIPQTDKFHGSSLLPDTDTTIADSQSPYEKEHPIVTQHVTAYSQPKHVTIPASYSQSLTHITVTTSSRNGSIPHTDKANTVQNNNVETVASILTHRRSVKTDQSVDTTSAIDKLLDNQKSTDDKLVDVTWTELAAAILAKTMLTTVVPTMQQTALIVFIIMIISACFFYFSKYYLNSVSFDRDLVK